WRKTSCADAATCKAVSRLPAISIRMNNSFVLATCMTSKKSPPTRAALYCAARSTVASLGKGKGLGFRNSLVCAPGWNGSFIAVWLGRTYVTTSISRLHGEKKQRENDETIRRRLVS